MRGDVPLSDVGTPYINTSKSGFKVRVEGAEFSNNCFRGVCIFYHRLPNKILERMNSHTCIFPLCLITFAVCIIDSNLLVVSFITDSISKL
jgi:hypothetical protein